MNFPVLSCMTFLPIAAGLLLLLARSGATARMGAFVIAGVELFMAVLLWMRLPNDGEVHFMERLAWMPSLGVEYFVGLDGIGLLFVLLTTIVFPMAFLVSWREERPAYWALLLMLQGGLIGTFTALNFIHWFFFWEISLIPAFFLVRVAGGPERVAAATRFFIYTMVGSIAMLAGFLGLYQITGTFDFVELAQGTSGEALGASSMGSLIFFLVLLGLAVKLPLMPFHGWLPATYTQAASPVTMVLTGVMSKMGVYGLVRVLLPIFPEQIQAWQGLLMTVTVITIVYSAFAALAQSSLKALLAYSSINHLAYCALGTFAAAKAGESASFGQAAALNGVLLQVFSHGLLAAGLFAFAEFLARRNAAGVATLEGFGGLRKIAPATAGFMSIALFASLGLPGLSGFVAEFFIFQGTFALYPWAASAALIGLLVTAVFLLTVIQKIFTGPVAPQVAGAADLQNLEKAAVVPALLLSLLVGVYPAILGAFINPAVLRMVSQLQL